MSLGTGGENGGLHFEVVEQEHGDPQAEEGWREAHVDLTPNTIPNLVTAAGGTLVALTGRESLVQPFSRLVTTLSLRRPNPNQQWPTTLRCCSPSASSTSPCRRMLRHSTPNANCYWFATRSSGSGAVVDLPSHVARSATPSAYDRLLERFRLQAQSLQDEDIAPAVALLVIPGEQIVSYFKAARDFVVFTDKRLIAVNVQGMTGKKRDVTSLPLDSRATLTSESLGTYRRLRALISAWNTGGSGRSSTRLRTRATTEASPCG
jgi:hypothetical protein